MAQTRKVSQVTVYEARGIANEGNPYRHNSLAESVVRRRIKIKDTVQSGKLTENLAAEMNTELDSLLSKFSNPKADTQSLLSREERMEVQERLQKIDRQLFHAITTDASTVAPATKRTGRIIDLYG